MSDHLIAEANRHAKALTDERNNLVVELNLLREWQRETIQNERAHHAERKDAIARAERAELEVERLKRDYEYDHKCLCEVRDRCELWKLRAERAEAELTFQQERNSRLFEQRDAAVEAQDKAETALAATAAAPPPTAPSPTETRPN